VKKRAEAIKRWWSNRGEDGPVLSQGAIEAAITAGNLVPCSECGWPVGHPLDCSEGVFISHAPPK
jgi:hypothetical protein